MAGDAHDSILSTIANSIGIATFVFSALNLWVLFYRRSLKFESDVQAFRWDDLKANLDRREAYLHLYWQRYHKTSLSLLSKRTAQPLTPPALARFRSSQDPQISNASQNPPVTDNDLMYQNAEMGTVLSETQGRLGKAREILHKMESTWDPIKDYLGIRGMIRGYIESILSWIIIPWFFFVTILRAIYLASSLYTTPYVAFSMVQLMFEVKEKFLEILIKKGQRTASVWRSMFGWGELSDQYQQFMTAISEIDSRMLLIQGLKCLQLQITIDSQASAIEDMEKIIKCFSSQPSDGQTPSPVIVDTSVGETDKAHIPPFADTQTSIIVVDEEETNKSFTSPPSGAPSVSDGQTPTSIDTTSATETNKTPQSHAPPVPVTQKSNIVDGKVKTNTVVISPSPTLDGQTTTIIDTTSTETPEQPAPSQASTNNSSPS